MHIYMNSFLPPPKIKGGGGGGGGSFFWNFDKGGGHEKIAQK